MELTALFAISCGAAEARIGDAHDQHDDRIRDYSTRTIHVGIHDMTVTGNTLTQATYGVREERNSASRNWLGALDDFRNRLMRAL